MDGVKPTRENRDSAAGDVFPASIHPPWKHRHNRLKGVALPLALIAAGVAAFCIHFATQSDSSGTTGISLAANTSRDRADGAAFADTHPELMVALGTDDNSNIGSWNLNQRDLDITTDADVEALLHLGSRESEVNVSPSPSTSKENIVYRGQVGKGSTLTHRLGEHGLSARNVGEIVQALVGHYDFRASRPEHHYELEINQASGLVERFRYQASRTEIFEVHRRAGTLKGKRVPVNTTSQFIKVGRRIRASLAQTISNAGLKRRVFNAFMRTFGREMQFQNNIRESDTIRMIVEEERLDEEFIRYKAVWALEYNSALSGRMQAFYYKPPEGKGRFYNEKGLSFERTKLRTPCNYTHISSPFDPRRLHPVLKRRVPHRGVDFAGPRGTPVWATANGTVTWIGKKGANGNLVILRHEGRLESMYAHLQKFARGLKRGQEVRQGQLIGYIGSTGRSTGPHLHFGLRLNGRFVDPMEVRSTPGRPIAQKHRGQLQRHIQKLQRELKRINVQ